MREVLFVFFFNLRAEVGHILFILGQLWKVRTAGDSLGQTGANYSMEWNQAGLMQSLD